MRTALLRLAVAMPADFGPGPHRGRRFHHPGLVIIGLLLLAAVIMLAILLYRTGRRSVAARPEGMPSPAHPAGPPPPSPALAAEAILSARFARGEISVEEFTAARDALRS